MSRGWIFASTVAPVIGVAIYALMLASTMRDVKTLADRCPEPIADAGLPSFGASTLKEQLYLEHVERELKELHRQLDQHESRLNIQSGMIDDIKNPPHRPEPQ